MKATSIHAACRKSSDIRHNVFCFITINQDQSPESFYDISRKWRDGQLF